LPIAPNAPLRIIQLGSLVGANPPTCDPALDLSAPARGDNPSLRAALSDYEATRSPEDLARLPVKPGMALTLFEARPLVPAALRWAREAPSEAMRAHRAFLCVCHTYTDADGNERRAEEFGAIKDLGRGMRQASDEWLDHVAESYGNDAVVEVATVAFERADAGPRALRPFALPRGRMLPL
jgi:hypothetical protein